MQYLALGLALGFASLVAPGPIGLTLVGVASRQGARSGLRGAAGVAGGDLAASACAVAIVAASATLPASVFVGGQLAAAVVLFGMGVALSMRPGAIETVVQHIRRPGRTLFLLTSLAPHAAISWIALFAAMPFAGELRALVWFGIGAVAASALWHTALALVAAWAGLRFGPGFSRLAARAGGVTMIGFGVGAAWITIG